MLRKALALIALIFPPLLFAATPIPAIPTDDPATVMSAVVENVPADELYPGADRIGAPDEGTSVARVYRGNQPLGYLYLNSALVNSTGYAGKPIHVVAGIDENAVIQSARLVKHHEPIVLVGIPESKITALIDRYVGLDLVAITRAQEQVQTFDAISGATVTIRVINDSVLRAGIRVARDKGLGGLKAAETAPSASVREDIDETHSWEELLAEGSIARLDLSVDDINRAFKSTGDAEAIARPEAGPGDDVFIHLFAAQVSVPSIGRSLLGDTIYQQLADGLQPGQQAILLMGYGRYSFKGSGYVRGGIFDRFEVIQGDDVIRFRDLDHRRMGRVAAEGAPQELQEIDLFTTPGDVEFAPGEEWQVELLVNRATGPRDKAFVTVALDYRVPDKYLAFPEPGPAAAQAGDGSALPFDESAPLWRQLWQEKTVAIGILTASLLLLTFLFFFQDWVTSIPDLTPKIRIPFLVFTLVFIGFYATAQLSVVNILSVINAALTGFSWEYFLMEPLIFILWGAVFAGLLFWGRGAYCGWLCPFGALQELSNKLARLCKVPQWLVPWKLHERLWPIKYLIFLGLFGVSLHSLSLAEQLAEVEPFKTAIILHFVRDWPYVLFALAMLLPGLFIERFYCRYLCPLGAALAIPARLRMFVWLKRYRQCGNPCQVCENECPVQAIHPEGDINPNECIYCMHCQERYHDDHVCPVRVKARQRRERHEMIASDRTADLGRELLAQIRRDKT